MRENDEWARLFSCGYDRISLEIIYMIQCRIIGNMPSNLLFEMFAILMSTISFSRWYNRIFRNSVE